MTPDAMRRDAARKIRVSRDANGDEMLVLDAEPGAGRNRIVMMAWERPYMEALVANLDISPADHVLEVGFGLGFSARAIAARRPQKHVVLEPAPAVVERAAGFDVRCDTWQRFCGEADERFDAVFFDDFPLADGEPQTPRWPRFLRAVARVLEPTARITGYLADAEALSSSQLPPGFAVERILPCASVAPVGCPYQIPGLDACLVPLIRFTRGAS